MLLPLQECGLLNWGQLQGDSIAVLEVKYVVAKHMNTNEVN